MEPIYLAHTNGHSKFYDMYDNGDGTFSAHWGKIGTSGRITVYSINKWYDKYTEKLNKGYREITISMGEY